VLELTEGTLQLEPESILVGDEHQTQLLIANAWRFKGGNFVESWWLPEDAEKWDAFAG
jgi:hypothetical protein